MRGLRIVGEARGSLARGPGIVGCIWGKARSNAEGIYLGRNGRKGAIDAADGLDLIYGGERLQRQEQESM